MTDSLSAIDLYWIPLGAGGHSVRANGKVYEAVASALQHRPRCDIYHTALQVRLPGQRWFIEMTPIPDRRGGERGVVAEGAVGTKWAGRLRIFRYEVRCWRDGIVPDLEFAVASPSRLTEDPLSAQAVLERLPSVPTLVWGRDELRAGDMWSCNSIISWVLAQAGLDTGSIKPPGQGRAPGWDAGIEAARRQPASRSAAAA
jgi:hypothetical protein